MTGKLSIVLLLILSLWGCSGREAQRVELMAYPLDSMQGVIARTGVAIDRDISSDGKGSLRIEAPESTTVRLFETGDIDIEDARLFYSARIRTEGVEGKVYLEMWCSFPGKGEFFSRALHTPVSGSNEWLTQETFFNLRDGEDPDNIKLNIAVTGPGTVWIDDIRLERGDLE